MRKNLSVRVVLALEEAKQKLQAEINELQAEIAEIDAFMAEESGKPEPKQSGKNVPHGTATNPASTSPGMTDTPFDSSVYTDRATKNLPERFDIQAMQDALGVSKKSCHSLITTWQRRKWIERYTYGHYRRLPAFGGKTPEPIAPPSPAPEFETRRSHPEPDPLRGNPIQVEPTEEQKATVTRLNVEAARETLEKRLESKQRQRENCIDGSASADVLDEEIEKLEDELAALE